LQLKDTELGSVVVKSKYGFPKAHAPKAKFFQGFQTGDIVKADVIKGKFAGQYVGRIAIRFRPSFTLQLPTQKIVTVPGSNEEMWVSVAILW